MRLDEEQQSTNIEDRRGYRVSPGLAGGGIGTLAIVLIALFFGVDPSVLFQGTTSVDTTPPPESRQADSNDEMRNFVSRVLGSTERTWAVPFTVRATQKCTSI